MTPIDPSRTPGLDPTRQVGADATAPESTSSRKLDGPAFHVLLERLQERARELETTSRELEGSADLTQAVDAARASLEDANELGDRLLEAFRGAQHRMEGGAS
jgi:hypothetical protein